MFLTVIITACMTQQGGIIVIGIVKVTTSLSEVSHCIAITLKCSAKRAISSPDTVLKGNSSCPSVSHSLLVPSKVRQGGWDITGGMLHP